MTTQPENKDKAEQKISKDELSDRDLANVTGGEDKTQVQHSEFVIVKLVDAATPKFLP